MFLGTSRVEQIERMTSYLHVLKARDVGRRKLHTHEEIHELWKTMMQHGQKLEKIEEAHLGLQRELESRMDRSEAKILARLDKARGLADDLPLPTTTQILTTATTLTMHRRRRRSSSPPPSTSSHHRDEDRYSWSLGVKVSKEDVLCGGGGGAI